jgi:hypothetical protein
MGKERLQTTLRASGGQQQQRFCEVELMPSPALRFHADSPSALADWLLDQHKGANLRAPSALYALVDWGRLTPNHLVAFKRWQNEVNSEAINLYEDMEGLALAQTGPRLLELTEAMLPEAASWSWQTHALSFLLGAVSGRALTEHLQGLREATLPDGGQALFRFQDVNVTSHLFQQLTPGLMNQMLGPLSLWAVPDVCGQVNVLQPQPGYRRMGGLRFEKQIFDRLNEALVVYTVADQVRDVDTALLLGMTACQIKHLISQRLSDARSLGLQQASDRALYVVLSLQLPASFEREEPFSTALTQARQGTRSFGDAMDMVSPQQWEQWDTKHAN